MLDIREVNRIIENKIKTPQVAEIYQTVANNLHLDFGTAVKLGTLYGVKDRCDTYDGWNKKGYRIIKGEHALYEIPKRGAVACERETYFTITQTTAANKLNNNRTAGSLIKSINNYTFLGIATDKINFSAIKAAIRNYAEQNNIGFDEEYAPVIVSGIASILAYTCKDYTELDITPEPFPETDYLQNAKVLKEINEQAQALLELIEISEIKANEKKTENTSSKAAKPVQTETGKQSSLFDEVTAESKPEQSTTVRAEPDKADNEETPVSDKNTQNKSLTEEYFEVQEKYGDGVVIYRVGDFYEVLGDNAKIVADALELTLISRSSGNARVPMVGFPYHIAQSYIAQLIEKNVFPKLIVVDPLEQVTERVIEPELVVEEEVAEEKSEQETSQLDAEQATISLEDNIKEWYLNAYPTDDAGNEIDEQAKFNDLFEYVKQANADKIYNILAYDSVVRERTFTQLAKITNKTYEDIYNAYIGKSTQYAFERACAKALQFTQETGEPYVTIEWSESGEFKENQIMPLSIAEQKFIDADNCFKDIGYDKVKFNIYCVYRGEMFNYVGRYDIGDGDNGIVNHLRLIAQYSNDNGSKKELFDFAKYLSLHIALSKSENYLETYPHRETLNSLTDVNEFGLPAADDEDSKRLENSAQSLQAENVEILNESESVSTAEEDEIAAEENRLTFGGVKTRFYDNLEAIKTLRRIQQLDCPVTEQDRATMKKYIGWGGISDVFDKNKSNWDKERQELLQYVSKSEYNSAAESTLDAFYTPYSVIKGIYAALERMGVKGNNRILEPSMGIGNFLRVMPDEIAAGSKIVGVEKDTLTGEMAQKIYPDADIYVKGFERMLLDDNSFDVVVGNVPFGQSKPVDIQKDYDFELHNFVIAKSLDKVRAGGIVALITTASSLDSWTSSNFRQYIAKNAELIGAIRLPYNTFQANANTKVTTDILFLRKRKEKLSDIDAYSETWIERDSLRVGSSYQSITISQYFIEHPEMILGKYEKVSGRWGEEYALVLQEGENLSDKLLEAIKNLPENIFNPEENTLNNVETYQEELSLQTFIPADENVKNLGLTIVDGQVYQRQNDIMVKVDMPEKTKDAVERVAAMLNLKKEVRNIIDIQINSCTDEELAEAQARLNVKYDNFVKKYKYLNDSKNIKVFEKDIESGILLALEDVERNEKGKIVNVSKGAIFTKRTITPNIRSAKTTDALEALQLCQNEIGRVDLHYIENITGKDFDTIIEELKGFIYKNPETASVFDKYRGYETAEKYLSGDVRGKLEQARIAAEKDESYLLNVTALEQVQPRRIPAEEILVNIGAMWIDDVFYQQFIEEHILECYRSESVYVKLNQITNEYIVEGNLPISKQSVRNNQTYGTAEMSAVQLFDKALNMRTPNVYDRVDDGNGKTKPVFNAQKTAAARAKQALIKEEFKKWIFEDYERREYLTDKYNEIFNRYRLPEYDGSHLSFPEMNPDITLNDYQKNVVWRGINEGTVLLHHCVGAGKTFEMDAMIMKMRQLGIAKKPMQVVPKALLESAEMEFRKLYPNANLLVVKPEDVSPSRRREFLSRVALGDWDCVIISQSQFDKIKVATERAVKKKEEEINKVQTALEQAKDNHERRISVKALQRTIKRLRDELDKLMKENDGPDALLFEDLGVDYLFVDEAHSYKNKFLFTKMSNVAGINQNYSQRASLLDCKIDYINELHHGDSGVIFATGTPISNTMAEMYTMQSYLQKNRLEQMGLDVFDNWAATYGEIVNSLELKVAGDGYKSKKRFASFINVPELMQLYGLFADIKTAKQLKLPVPKATYEKVIVPKSEITQELMRDISRRADDVSERRVEPEEDNMLKITSDGRKIALDVRLYNPELSEEPDGKIQVCAEKVAEVYNRTNDDKSTQIIFCDMSTPKDGMKYENYNPETDGVNVYFEMKRKLIDLGIKAEEIAFIHDYNGKDLKNLFEKVNSGEIRVLMGSTQKCGTGVNVQKKLIACHHLDIPYRPSDMEQREGRIIRQGNENKNVTIYTYAREGTFDAYLFQILETKQNFISQLLDFKVGSRKIDDVADTAVLSYSEMKAAISGDQRIIELEKLRQEEEMLRILDSEYKKNRYRLQQKVNDEYPKKIEKINQNIEKIEKDIKTVAANSSEEFKIIIGNKVYTGRNEETANAFVTAFKQTPQGNKVGEYCGLELYKEVTANLMISPDLLIEGEGTYRVKLSESNIGALMRLDNVVKDLNNKKEKLQSELVATQKNIEEGKEQLSKPFDKEQELRTVVNRIIELKNELAISDKIVDDVIQDTDKPDNDVKNDDIMYRRLPLEYAEKSEIYQEIATRFSVEKINEILNSRTAENEPERTQGIDYNNPATYTSEDLKATLENYHSFVTANGFKVEELFNEGDRVNAIIHVVLNSGLPTDEYVIGLNYDVKTGEWGQGKYGFNSYSEVLNYYDNEYRKGDILMDNKTEEEKFDNFLKEQLQEIKWLEGKTNGFTSDEIEDIVADLKESFENSNYYDPDIEDDFDMWYDDFAEEKIIPYLEERSAETLFNQPLYGLVFNWKGLKEENYICTAEELQAYEEYFNPDEERQDLGYSANQTYIIYKLNGATPEETAENVKAFMQGGKNDEQSESEIDGWYWETITDQFYTGKPNLLAINMINALGIKEEDLRMKEELQAKNVSSNEMQKEIEPYAIVSDEDETGETVYKVKMCAEYGQTTYVLSGVPFKSKDALMTELRYMQGLPFWKDKEFKEVSIEELEEISIARAKLQEKNSEEITDARDYEEPAADTGNSEMYNFYTAPINYVERVKELIEIEFADFEKDMLEKTNKEIFANAYKISVTGELYDTLLNSEDNNIDDEFYQALYEDRGKGILHELYDEFINDEYASVDHYSDTIEFIQNYCYNNHADALKAASQENNIFARRAYLHKLPVESVEANTECKTSIEEYIKNNYDGKHLNMDNVSSLIDFYGEERINYVLANTVQLNETDGRYSLGNKAWASGIVVLNDERERRRFNINSHPAVLDGFISIYRKQLAKNAENLSNKDKAPAQEDSNANERYDKVMREDFPRDFADEDPFVDALLDDVESGNFLAPDKDKHSMAMPAKTTLGEDLANKPVWNKVVLPTAAIAIKGDKNVKIKMPAESAFEGSEFWVSRKFIKDLNDKDFKLILPNNYTVRLKTAQGDELSLSSKEVIEDLAQHALSYTDTPSAQVPVEKDVIDLDSTENAVEISEENISRLNLSPIRQDLVKNVVSLMESGDVEFLRNWATTLPKNGTTGREYSGINNLLLTLEQHKRNYSDSRWCTFNQIQEHKWKLKKGSKAAAVEVVKFIDKTTKKEFDEKSVEGMTDEERREYWDKNVYPMMKSYSVFNADCIEGIPEEKVDVLSDEERNERCEKILANSPAKITYDGGNDAYYRPSTDTIHLPKREHFYSMEDFYLVALHEVGHSTGHPSRLNRNQTGMFGSENYAREELCAELGSLFTCQSLGMNLSETNLKSSAAYLKGWAESIRKDPKYLFNAISDANKISKYVIDLQSSATVANDGAAQDIRLERLQRGRDKQNTGSKFAGKTFGQSTKDKSNAKPKNNSMEQ